MRKLLILTIIVIFLYSSWAPVWGSAAATWGLVLYSMSQCWGLSSRVTPPIEILIILASATSLFNSWLPNLAYFLALKLWLNNSDLLDVRSFK